MPEDACVRVGTFAIGEPKDGVDPTPSIVSIVRSELTFQSGT